MQNNERTQTDASNMFMMLMITLLMFAVIIFIVRESYNMVIPHISPYKSINMKQAAALFVLFSILVKGSCVCMNVNENAVAAK